MRVPRQRIDAGDTPAPQHTSKKMLEISLSLLRDTGATDDHELRIRALWQAADTLLQERRFDEADELLGRYLAGIDPDNEFLWYRTRLRHAHGVIVYRRGDTEYGERIMRDALENLYGPDMKELKMMCLADAGTFTADRPMLSNQFYERAVDVSGYHTPLLSRVAACHHNLAVNYDILGETTVCVRHAILAMGCREALTAPLGIVQALWLLSYAQFKNGHARFALIAAERALRLAEKREFTAEVAMAEKAMGVYLVALDRKDEARERLARAQALFRDLELPEDERESQAYLADANS